MDDVQQPHGVASPALHAQPRPGFSTPARKAMPPPEVRAAAIGHLLSARRSMEAAARAQAMMAAMFAAGADRQASGYAAMALRHIEHAGTCIKAANARATGIA